jgi:hypothetical protein
MEQDDNPKWYFVAPVLFLALGVFQLFTREQAWVGLVTVVAALFMAVVAFYSNRKPEKHESTDAE